MNQFTSISIVSMVLMGGALTAHAADYFDETKAAAVFAFDSVSIPCSQNLRLEMRHPTRHPDNPVVKRRAPGTLDALGVQFYGSIIKEKPVSSDHPWVEPKKIIEPLRSLKLPVADEQKILSGNARQLFGLS